MRKPLFLAACLAARLAEDALLFKARRLQPGGATPWDGRALLRIHRAVLRWIARLPPPPPPRAGGRGGQLGLSDRRVEIAPYDPRWPALFAAQAERIGGAFAGESAVLHHIGSTSVPGLAAKPIVDLALELPPEFLRERAETVQQRMEGLGYRYFGDWGRRGGRVFVKTNARGDAREFLCQVHGRGSASLAKLLRFRSLLREDPAACAAYAAAKEKLARMLSHYRITYVWAKGHYLKEIELQGPGPKAWADDLLAAQSPSLCTLVRKAAWRALSRPFGGKAIHPMEVPKPAR